jgi:sugar O-acyltransferase (sialic acid O-acetyltransferase NeuD family)
MTTTRIVVVGGGGHASDVLGVVEDLRIRDPGCGIEVVGLVHDTEVDRHRFEGRGVEQVGGLDDIATVGATHYVIAVEYPDARKAVHDRIAGCGLGAATLVHPAATVGTGVELGEGTVVFAGARISPRCRIGAHCVISNLAVIGYSAVLADFVSVMPAGVISGDAVLGEGTTIGTNACVIEGVKVGEWSTLGAGAVAVAFVPPRVTAIGVPAKWKS